jgi:hypothetical protein
VDQIHQGKRNDANHCYGATTEVAAALRDIALKIAAVRLTN